MAPSSPDPEFVLRGSPAPISCLCTTDTSLLSGTQDGQILVWDKRSRRIQQTIQAHTSGVLSIITRNTSTISQGREGCMRIWNSKWELERTISGSTEAFCGSCPLQDDRIAMPATSQSDVAVVSMRPTPEISKVLSPKTTSSDKGYGMCMCLKAIRKDSGQELLLAGYESGDIAVWDFKDYTLAKVHEESVMCLDYCETTNRGCSGSADEKIGIWSLENDKVKILKHVDVTNPGLGCVRFRGDGRIMVSGGWDGQVRVFSGKTFKQLAVLSYHKESIMCLMFNEDNTFCAGSKDGTISMWSVYKDS